MIYRLLLLTQNTTTNEPQGNHTLRTPGRGADDVVHVQTGEEPIGAVQCVSWLKYNSGFQVSILRANRQIHLESWSIFHLENFWTVVRVNKAGFGKEMKDRGFAVATGRDLWRDIKLPVMRVTVSFPSLQGQEHSDTLLVASVHLAQLMRGLGTAKGASGMEVTIHVLPPPTGNPPDEGSLLAPFKKLRSIRRLTMLGVAKQTYVVQLTRAITTTNGITRTFDELTASVRSLQGYIEEERWGSAIPQAEKLATLMADCKTVYGNRFFGIETGLNINAAVARSQAARDITIAIAMGIAQVTLFMRQYGNTILFATHALELVNGITAIHPANPITAANPVIIVAPNHPLVTYPLFPLISTGTVPFENEVRCFILTIRARAYIGLRRGKKALNDIEKAQELMPNSLPLFSVSMMWDAMFDPIPGSPIDFPAACPASAHATNFAATIEALEVD